MKKLFSHTKSKTEIFAFSLSAFVSECSVNDMGVKVGQEIPYWSPVGVIFNDVSLTVDFLGEGFDWPSVLKMR